MENVENDAKDEIRITMYTIEGETLRKSAIR
ncbi:hypothetical protein CWD94_11990 [Lysinibacillus xylanilyticus]|uniref:Uncharacterized protein n=1 Tax=Lysinibacillus xylanilyticus TaxID=582475 RepID=A0A2M9Q612_9BACI|nr:hypothetical protein CWD94_11990 [Lysinibacillus xylanilyticus]